MGGPLCQTQQMMQGLSCLLMVLPWSWLPGQDLWESSLPSLLSCRELYSQFLREMIIQPGIAKANMGVSREDVTFEDHVSRGRQQDCCRVGSNVGFRVGEVPSTPEDRVQPISVPSGPSSTSFLHLAPQPLEAIVSALFSLGPGPGQEYK